MSTREPKNYCLKLVHRRWVSGKIVGTTKNQQLMTRRQLELKRMMRLATKVKQMELKPAGKEIMRLQFWLMRALEEAERLEMARRAGWARLAEWARPARWAGYEKWASLFSPLSMRPKTYKNWALIIKLWRSTSIVGTPVVSTWANSFEQNIHKPFWF